MPSLERAQKMPDRRDRAFVFEACDDMLRSEEIVSVTHDGLQLSGGRLSSLLPVDQEGAGVPVPHPVNGSVATSRANMAAINEGKTLSALDGQGRPRCWIIFIAWGSDLG